MRLIGLMPVRNEDWIIGLSLRAALLWCDAVVVLLHNCTDDTERIVTEIGLEAQGRVRILRDDALEWEEMRMRNETLIAGRKIGGTHFALIDADEVVTGDLLPRIRNLIDKTQPGAAVLLPWLCCRGIDRVMISGMWANQNAGVAFPDDPVYHWQARAGYDLHHRHPMGREITRFHPIDNRNSGLMHLQFASWRRLLAKQFLYQLIEIHRWPGRRSVEDVVKNYAPTVDEAAAAQLGPVPESWWAPYSHLMQYLNVDAEPWQEKECKRLIVEEQVPVRGLNDFGLLTEWGMECFR